MVFHHVTSSDSLHCLSDSITMSASSASQERRQKRLRKGTHSCLECRKRKIRCDWPVESPQCDGCASRKVRCVEQAYGDVPRASPRTKTMRQRISDLEGAIDKIFRHLDDLGIDIASIHKDFGLEFPVSISTRSDKKTPNSSTQRAVSSFAKLSVSEDLSV